MSGQHVGTLSDAIADDGRSAARSQMRAVMKARGKVFTGKSDLGNGAVCPVNPEHGKMFNMTSGRDWCPHHSHDAERVKGATNA